MSRKQGRVHVVRVRKTHVDTQGGRREYVSVYLRRTYRDGTAVRGVPARICAGQATSSAPG